MNRRMPVESTGCDWNGTASGTGARPRHPLSSSPARCGGGLGWGLVVAALSISLLAGCADKRNYSQAVYLLVDTSGTYSTELDRAQHVINYLLGTLNPGDSFAIARVKSRSFSEKEIVVKATFVKDPLQVNQQKRAFKEQAARLSQKTQTGSAYTDITGGMLQAAEFLHETGAGRKTLLIFSDMY